MRCQPKAWASLKTFARTSEGMCVKSHKEMPFSDSPEETSTADGGERCFCRAGSPSALAFQEKDSHLIFNTSFSVLALTSLFRVDTWRPTPSRGVQSCDEIRNATQVRKITHPRLQVYFTRD